MFKDDYNVTNETADPSSLLLMEIIKDAPKEGVLDTIESDSVESQINDEIITGNQLDRFITEHEPVNSDQFLPNEHTETLTQVSDPVDEYPSSSAKKLKWWERPFSKTSIGIEVKPHAISAVKVRTLGNKREVVQVEKIGLDEIQRGDTLAIGHQVEQILRKIKSNNSPVTSLICGSDVNMRLLRMPKVSKKEIHEALLWKNKKELHFFNDAPTILHYIILDEEQAPAAGEFYVLVIAVKEDQIRHHLEIMERAKIIPSKLTIRPIAQWNFMKCIPGKSTNSLVIDIGFENCHLTFFRSNTLQFAREIPVGGNHFTSALMQTIFVDNKSYILSWEEAEALKIEIGLPHEVADGKTSQGIPHSEIAVMMRPVAEKLASEIRMSLDYYKENFNVETYDNIYFTGNAIRLKRLRSFLESFLSQRMRPLFVTEGVSFMQSAQSKEQESLPMDTIGAALSKGSDLNFLPPHAKKELSYRKALSKAISGFIVLLGICGSSLFIMNKKNSDTNIILLTYKESLERVRNENREYETLMNEINTLNTVQTKIKEETLQDSSVTSILRWVSGIIPDEIVLDELSWGEAYNEIELRRSGTGQNMKSNGNAGLKPPDAPKELHVKGTVYKDVFYADIHLLNLITAMEKNPFFQDVQLKEKRHDAAESVLLFELIAKKR